MVKNSKEKQKQFCKNLKKEKKLPFQNGESTLRFEEDGRMH